MRKEIIINTALLLTQIILVVIHFFFDKNFLVIPEILISLTGLYVAKTFDK